MLNREIFGKLFLAFVVFHIYSSKNGTRDGVIGATDGARHHAEYSFTCDTTPTTIRARHVILTPGIQV